MVVKFWSPKDPNDIVDYWFEAAPFMPAGATIVAATITLPAEEDQPTPEGPFEYLSSAGDSFTDDMVRVRFAGGVPGPTPDKPTTEYDVTYLLTLDTGEVLEITKTLKVKERKQS